MTDQTPGPDDTGASTGGGTSTGGSGGAGQGSAAAIDWQTAFNALGDLGHEVVDRFKERASGNAARVREGKYGANELIDDAEWFWKNFVGDAVRGFEILRATPAAAPPTTPPTTPPPTPPPTPPSS
jgi:hypothetical protein